MHPGPGGTGYISGVCMCMCRRVIYKYAHTPDSPGGKSRAATWRASGRCMRQLSSAGWHAPWLRYAWRCAALACCRSTRINVPGYFNAVNGYCFLEYTRASDVGGHWPRSQVRRAPAAVAPVHTQRGRVAGLVLTVLYCVLCVFKG